MIDLFENDIPPSPQKKDIPPEPKYKVGDSVQLKSGGPEMIISDMRRPGNRYRYTCQWFSGKKLESGEFPEESLQVPETKK